MPPVSRALAAALALWPATFAVSLHAQSAPPAARPLSPVATLAQNMLARGDRNADQKLSRAELATLSDAWWAQLDPDEVGGVAQQEFLQRFEGIPLPPPAQRQSGLGIATTSAALGFFLAADENRDGTLSESELRESLIRWLVSNNTSAGDAVDRDALVQALTRALPRTNMSGIAGRDAQDPIPGLPTPPPSPVRSPAESMRTIQLVDGFALELAATEPMIEDPVALSFDEDGRAYVVEMRSYMLDIDRTHERDPISRISRLEDTDGDGRFDRSTVFVDGLVLPRAVAATKGGVFYVSDYTLYFARDTDADGRADRTELVDADYGKGNVEHAPNALFRAMDNWIYNGESPYRYRLVGDTLVKQETEQRGQWGMTQDNYGRLIYNVNNSQLLGDFAPPNAMNRNPHHPSRAGLNLFVSTDQRVFPIRMTTAINRGYSPEVLNPEGKAYVFASSCSPLIYRGDNFPADFVGDAFVADPALNLIKRNLVFAQNLTLTSKFAYDDREFLASTDERFRPSNLYNGPDGALWIVDLYRGIAQYGQFMTPYLRRDTLARGLDQGIHHGRLYRIVSTAKKPAAFPRLSEENSAALVARLSHPNGWIRDTAQRLLVERGDRTVAPALAELIGSSSDPLARIHALWTVEGLFAALPQSPESASAAGHRLIRLLPVDPTFALEPRALPDEIFRSCLVSIRSEDPKVQVAAIRVSDSLARGSAQREQALFHELTRAEPSAVPEVLFHLTLAAGNLPERVRLPLLATIASRASERLLIRDAILSGLQNHELQFLQLLLADSIWNESRAGRPALLQALAGTILRERAPAKIEALLTLASEHQGWRRRSLLDGLAGDASATPAARIAFPAAPAALLSLGKSPEPATRESAAKIAAQFSWPGHNDEISADGAAARALTADETALATAGAALYQQICAGCHGRDGEGLAPMAPPLANSDWASGSPSRLIRIVLQGLSGPVRVSGTLYQPPQILPEMPGVPTLADEELAAILTYVRRSWGHAAEPISPAQIASTRAATKNRSTPWTEAELVQFNQ